ncbi:DUF5615 family PIN-like protein [Candidatus Woesearchaeota archaeon]|nr:DUF5615 family PIN-like protein [Candidatus Woesearchaeota archaeon]
MLNIRIYLDDNLDKESFISLLVKESFEVISPRTIGMRHKKDEEHLKCAVLNNAILLTLDQGFQKLHKKLNHEGIITIYQQMNRRKNMNDLDIVKALKNIISLSIELKNKILSLNDFDY